MQMNLAHKLLWNSSSPYRREKWGKLSATSLPTMPKYVHTRLYSCLIGIDLWSSVASISRQSGAIDRRLERLLKDFDRELRLWSTLEGLCKDQRRALSYINQVAYHLMEMASLSVQTYTYWSTLLLLLFLRIQLLPILYNYLFFMKHEEMSLRNSASYGIVRIAR